jgi:hypothetical protein
MKIGKEKVATESKTALVLASLVSGWCRGYCLGHGIISLNEREMILRTKDLLEKNIERL